MEFKEFWRALSADERKDFADRCKTTVGHLNNVAYCEKPAGESLAISIDRESGGKIKCESVRPDVDWAYLRGSTASPPTVASRKRA